jgi:glycosyltransferase involved in cell wall biosynthesis
MLAFHRALGTWRASITCFIVLTEFAKRKFVEAGFPSHKFAVKPNFADHDPGERVGPGTYALFVGRLLENKGLRVLLNAWKRLPQQHPLHIVGDGAERSIWQAEARELPGVTFRGRLPRHEVIEAVKNARFLIVPSTLYEGFPMCIVESYACGTPVLCSRLGALAEIVQDRVTGVHFNPGDSLDLAKTVEWAWNHSSELVQMGRAARAKYETDYTAEKNYSLLMEIYEDALADCCAPRRLSLLRQPAISDSVGQ